MKATKQKTEPTPAATCAEIRIELEKTETQLAQVDPHKGTVDHVLELRRPLQERIAILRERLQLAEQRRDEAEYAQIENEIAELMEDSAQIENELQIAREKAEADLRQHINPDWLDGRGRFSSERPALGGLLGFCNCVSEVEGRRDAVRARINHLERKIADRRQERERAAAAERVDRRRRLIGGECIAVDLTAWRIEGMAGFVADVMDGLGARAIPAALVDQTRREIHLLIPSDSTARRWIDSGLIENAEQMDPAELCPAMAGVWSRATVSKKSGTKAGR